MIVGASDTAGGEMHAYLWQNGTMTDLGTLEKGESYAWAINNQGQITGYSNTYQGETHAFRWECGIMSDLGTLAGKYSFA